MSVKTIPVSITIKDTVAGTYLTVPVLPDTIPYKAGEKLADTVTVLNLGDIDIPSGEALDNMKWNSFFPARYDATYCKTAALKTPKEYKDIFTAWKQKGTPLQIIVTAAGINTRMYVRAFEWEYRGFEGDIYYELEFQQYKTIKPKKIKVGSTTPPKPNSLTPPDRPPAPKKPAPKYHNVRAGETLIKIAKLYGIKDWRNSLYIPNKKPNGPLGPDPGVLQVGQRLRLP